MAEARGPFEVKMAPQAPPDDGSSVVSCLLLDKSYQGGLVAVSKGLMIAWRSGVEGSAVYSAIERVQGSLDGREGEFSLQHTGVMTRGEGQLTITVAPDSGTGALEGLTGRMTIEVGADGHTYALDYALSH